MRACVVVAFALLALDAAAAQVGPCACPAFHALRPWSGAVFVLATVH
jgi:hypothetical protein